MSKNPKIVVDAFLPDLLAIGETTLRPITMGTLLILEKIDSPLVNDAAIAAAKRNKGKFTVKLSNDDVARVVFVLTHSGKESLVLLSGGRQAFDSAVYEFLDRIPVSDMPKLGGLITEHFSRAFSTVIGGADDGAEKKTASAIPGMNSSDKTTASAGR